MQSPINVSSKTVKKQVFPVQRTTRFLGYKNDDGAYATSGSIVDCIHEMSKAAYQLKAHLQAQRESFGNLTVVSFSFVHLHLGSFQCFINKKASSHKRQHSKSTKLKVLPKMYRKVCCWNIDWNALCLTCNSAEALGMRR